MTTRQRWALIAVLAFLAATHHTHTSDQSVFASPPVRDVPPVPLTYVISRTAAATASTNWSFTASWTQFGGNRAFVGAAGARIERGHVVSGKDTLMSTLGEGDMVEASADGQRIRPCSEDGLCVADQTTVGALYAEHYSDSGEGPGDNNRFYVVIESTRAVGFSFTGHGWKIRKTTFSYRWLDSDKTDAPQVRAHGDGAEIFTSGRLSGGRYGSIAAITPPCSGDVESVVLQGVGQLTLSAPGVADASATCPTSPWATSVSNRATTWTVHGASAGANGDDTARLFVVDLPRHP